MEKIGSNFSETTAPYRDTSRASNLSTTAPYRDTSRASNLSSLPYRDVSRASNLSSRDSSASSSLQSKKKKKVLLAKIGSGSSNDFNKRASLEEPELMEFPVEESHRNRSWRLPWRSMKVGGSLFTTEAFQGKSTKRKTLSQKTLNDQQRQSLRRFFSLFDHDGSGDIDANELNNLLEALDIRLQKNDVHRILREVDEAETGVVSFEEFLKFLSLRMIDSVRDASFVDTKLTLATLIVGKDTVLEEWIFSSAVRGNGLLGKMLWIMWYTGLLLGMISQQTLYLSWDPWRQCFNWCSVLMIPLPCFSFLALSVDLIKELLIQGEMWALLVLEASWMYQAIRLLHDVRQIVWISLLPSMLVSAISDAYPAKYRPTFQNKFFSGLLLAMGWWCVTVVFSWNRPMADHEWTFKSLKGSLATASVTNVGTAMLFALRNLWAAFMRPNNFVIIVSATRTVQVKIQDAAERLALHPKISTMMQSVASLRDSMGPRGTHDLGGHAMQSGQSMQSMQNMPSIAPLPDTPVKDGNSSSLSEAHTTSTEEDPWGCPKPPEMME